MTEEKHEEAEEETEEEIEESELVGAVEINDETETDECSGGEVKELFGAEVIANLHRLYKILDDEDYKTEAEKNALVFELVQYNAIFQHHLLKIHEKRFLNKWCCIKDDEDGVEATMQNYNLPMPYAERKNVSSHFRARIFQVFLEIIDLVTDVVFLVINLAPAYDDLFIASLAFILISVFARVLSAISMLSLADFSKRSRKMFFWAGFFINILETNVGVYLMKRSFILKDKNGLKNPYKAPWERDAHAERDKVSVFARNDLRAGKAELLNILAMTVLEDIPQLVIQFIYLDREDADGYDVIFYATLISTIVHIVLQGVEFIVTAMAICYHLRAVKNYRELSFNSQDIDNWEHRPQGNCTTSCCLAPCLGMENPMKQTRKIHIRDADGKEDGFFRSLNSPGVDQSIFKLALERTVKAEALENANAPFYRKLRHLGYFEAHEISAESMLSVVQNAPYLLEFDMPECKALTDDVVEALKNNCPMLIVVRLDCENLTNMEGLVELAQSLGGRLKSLTLQNAKKLEDRDLLDICSQCPKLESLELRGCRQVTNQGLKSVAPFCSNLQTFACTGVGWGKDKYYQENIRGVGVTPILGVIARRQEHILYKLDLETTRISDKDVANIAQSLGKLKVLWLTTTNISSAGVAHIAGAEFLQDSLEELWIGFNAKIDDGIFEHIPSLKQLKVLQFNETSVTVDGIKTFASQGSQTVTHLYCGGCPKLQKHGDEVAKTLAKGCRQLEVLHLQGTESENFEGLTDEGITALSRNLGRLKSIHLKRCSRVTQKGLKHLLWYHPHLEISGYTDGYNYTPRYTHDEIEELRTKVKASLRYKFMEGIGWTIRLFALKGSES